MSVLDRDFATIARDDEEDERWRRFAIGAADNLGRSSVDTSGAYGISDRDESSICGFVLRVGEKRECNGVANRGFVGGED